MRKHKIIPLIERDNEQILLLCEIWEESVRATHSFLTEADIVELRPVVQQAIQQIKYLLILIEDKPAGFAGVEDGKVEMLFVHPASRGKGLGKALLNHAVENLCGQLVDVNEQNTQAVGFYEACGFAVFDRSELDGQGRPFPILHMKR